MDTDTEIKLAGLEARIASGSCRITALIAVLEDILPEQDLSFSLQMRVELAKAHNDMFSALTKISPAAAQIFLEGNHQDD